MIKRSLVVTSILILIYSLVLNFIPNHLNTNQHLWNQNLIKAQEYLYSPEVKTKELHVIVGSSLSARLVMDSLPENYFNLAFGGQSLFDGLNIIIKKKQKPKSVLIEINGILREKNKSFENELFSPPNYVLKEYFPIFREKNQPIGIFKGIVANIIENKFFSNSQVSNTTNNKASSGEINEKILTDRINNESQLPKKKELETAYGKLQEYITELKKYEVKIVFFEMPIEPSLKHLNRPRTIREKFYQEFPVSQYLFIETPSNLSCRTTDGLHLDKQSAKKYTSYFRDQLERLELSQLETAKIQLEYNSSSTVKAIL